MIEKLNEELPKTLVGTFTKSQNFGFVIPDNRKIKRDIFISKSNWGKAKNNQKVVIEILKQPTQDKKAEGKIIEIIGYPDEAGVDMLSIIKDFDLPYEFPEEVIKEAKQVSKEAIGPGNRRDLRGEEIFTIDGEDAKDLDDAVQVKKDEDGNYILGVHIADVSHYVKEGSELNKEAINRGTSVYMLDRVIPMLPTELSNGICSLNQKEDRYALSCVMKIDGNGKVIDADIFKSIINVTKRMSYNEVQVCIDRNNPDVDYDEEKRQYAESTLAEDEKYFAHLDLMAELTRIIQKRREKDGYLSLDIPESKITFDENGKPINIEAYEVKFSNQIIEQFMLTANETIAERFFWLNAPFIYRVHEKPDEDKISELNIALAYFGYRVKGKKDDIKPTAFEQVLNQAKGKPEEKIVSNLILRTLKIARYEAECKGHFGISSKYYCHFTSPIRRYPDLFIHRIISYYLEKDYNVNEYFIEKYQKRAEKYAFRSSECEQNATKAERDAEDMKIAEYMEDKIGNQYDGIVSSVTKFGIFIRLENTVEGLVRFENMGDDYYVFNEAEKSLIGEATNKTYQLGDKVKVEVIGASKELRQVDFKLVEEIEDDNTEEKSA